MRSQPAQDGGSSAGGIDGTDGGGIDGTGMPFGTITGFGSVLVNGIEFSTGNATIKLDDSSAAQSSLRVGRVVCVDGSIDNKTAATITVDVALLYDPSDAVDARTLRLVQVAAEELTLEVQSFTARRPEDFRPSFAAMTKAKIGAALIGGGIANSINRELIAGLAIEYGIPTSGTSPEASEAGMLMSYGADLVRLYRITARYADQILRGARPADLPVEQASILTLAIDLKTAKALGIKIPNSILVRADRVIE